MDIEQIRILWERKEVVFTKHFLERLNQRNINIFQVEEALMNGVIIEERLKEKPHPKCIIQGSEDWFTS